MRGFEGNKKAGGGERAGAAQRGKARRGAMWPLDGGFVALPKTGVRVLPVTQLSPTARPFLESFE
eukprot:6005348-Heterocapsa_arctica.AAC.1